jgi:hypothetical protein
MLFRGQHTSPMKGIQWFRVAAMLACLSGVSVGLGAGPSPGQLIEPGVRVGQVRIGESREQGLGEKLAAQLGQEPQRRFGRPGCRNCI